MVEGVLLIVHGEAAPSNEEWSALVSSLGPTLNGRTRLPVLVVPSGVPSALQRAELQEATRLVTARTAILSNSRIARGISVALKWMGMQDIKTFDPADLAGALSYLEVSSGCRGAIRCALGRMRLEVGVGL
jgi:hypothetical protein